MAEASDNKEILAAIKATQAPPADFSASPELEKRFDKLIKSVEGLKGSFSSGINVQFPTLNFKDMFKNPFKGLGDRISKQFDKFGDVLKAPFKKLGEGLGKMFGFGKKSPEEKMADMSSKLIDFCLEFFVLY